MVPHCDRVQIIPGAQSLLFKRQKASMVGMALPQYNNYVQYEIGAVSDHVLCVLDGKTNQGQFLRGEGAKEKIT